LSAANNDSFLTGNLSSGAKPSESANGQATSGIS
jgi:hypothetical protein